MLTRGKGAPGEPSGVWARPSGRGADLGPWGSRRGGCGAAAGRFAGAAAICAALRGRLFIDSARGNSVLKPEDLDARDPEVKTELVEKICAIDW